MFLPHETFISGRPHGFEWWHSFLSMISVTVCTVECSVVLHNVENLVVWTLKQAGANVSNENVSRQPCSMSGKLGFCFMFFFVFLVWCYCWWSVFFKQHCSLPQDPLKQTRHGGWTSCRLRVAQLDASDSWQVIRTRENHGVQMYGNF